MPEKGKTPKWGVEMFDGYPHNPEVFMSHRNASLTPTGRLRLAQCIVESEWPLRCAADRFGLRI